MFGQKSYKRGSRWTNCPSSTVAGQPFLLAGTVAATDNVMVNNRRNGSGLIACVAQNNSGITLLPKRIVTWDTSNWRTKVGGYAWTAGEVAAGVVDDQMPAAGVADGDFFLLMLVGQAILTTPATEGAFGGSDISIADPLAVATGTSATNADAGRPKPVTLGGANFEFGLALQAKLAASALTEDLLAEINFPFL